MPHLASDSNKNLSTIKIYLLLTAPKKPAKIGANGRNNVASISNFVTKQKGGLPAFPIPKRQKGRLASLPFTLRLSRFVPTLLVKKGNGKERWVNNGRLCLASH
jgi:hypothetical protein